MDGQTQTPEPSNQPQEVVDYLGDAVYGHYNGYGVGLSVSDHRNPVAVYLEPEVIRALALFYERCSGARLLEDRR